MLSACFISIIYIWIFCGIGVENKKKTAEIQSYERLCWAPICCIE